MQTRFISEVRLKEIPEDSYLQNLPAIRHWKQLGSIFFEQPVTFFVGENGCGKSTILEALAVAAGFNPEGGSKNFSFATTDTFSSLHHYLTLIRRGQPENGFFLRAESFYNLATEIDFLNTAAPHPLLPSYGGTSLHRQSHGESFLSLMQNRFSGKGIYFLDEPEAALSPFHQMTLLSLIHSLVLQNAQFIIATHSPILMTYPGAQIYHLSQTGIHPISYQETEHYQLTRAFLENPEKMLHYLLDE